MPCYTMQSVAVEWSPNTSPDLLFKALEAAGLTPQKVATGIAFRDGYYLFTSHTMSLQGSQSEQRTKALKNAYAVQVAKDSFLKAGWVVKEAQNAQPIMMRRN
jgi:hypothetical protein